jgi:tetratricopeptide (TPR) repeat protein
MKRILFFIAILGCLYNANASDTKETRAKEAIKLGNDLYSKNDFEQAAKKYQSVIDSGYTSSELYYNLGNAWFKLHNFKSAILNYERAKLLNPGDKSIDFNLELSRSFVIDKIEALPELFFVSWYKWLRNELSTNAWAILSVCTFLILLCSALLYLLSYKLWLKKAGFWVGLVCLIISIVSFANGFQLQKMQSARNTAIIFTPTVTLKSSPAESGTNLFILHEGTKVEIIDAVGEWRNVSIADGNKGWVKLADIVVI